MLCSSLALSLTGALLFGQSTPEIEIDVMRSGGFSAAYNTLAPEFTRQTQIRINTVGGASMGGAPSSIPSRLARGEPADLVILAGEALDKLIADGLVFADSRVDLASSLIGMVVRAGESVPDISTIEAFKQTLLDAKSIAHSASASGTYLSTQLFPKLDIADLIMGKCIRVTGERVGTVVARGDAEIGFQQVSELLPIEGITYVGTIPEEMQKVTLFSAGITTRAKHVDAARALIEFLSSPEAAPVIAETGMEPLTKPSRSRNQSAAEDTESQSAN
jgi:molybdate transport system substrate-binding protein